MCDVSQVLCGLGNLLILQNMRICDFLTIFCHYFFLFKFWIWISRVLVRKQLIILFFIRISTCCLGGCYYLLKTVSYADTFLLNL